MLGVLGLGSHATLHFIKRLNEECVIRNGGFSTFPFKLLQIDFNTINPYLPNGFDELEPIVSNNIQELLTLGVTKICVPNITIHETLDRINPASQSLLIHPLKIAKKKARESNRDKILILGTRYTMEHGYVQSFFTFMTQVHLNDEQIHIIDTIRKRIYENGVTGKDNLEFRECIDDYNNDSVLIVIACTELSLLKMESDAYMDLLEILVSECVNLKELDSL